MAGVGPGWLGRHGTLVGGGGHLVVLYTAHYIGQAGYGKTQRVLPDVIGALQRTDDLHAALAAIEDAPRRQREQWEGAIARLLDQRERLRTQLRLLEEGTYTAADYAIARADILPALEATERDLEHAQRSLAQVRAPRIDVLGLEELCARIVAGAAKAGQGDRGAVLADLLTRIDVHADRLEIQGVLGDLVVPLPVRNQLNTDATGRISNEL